jgi:hypothetical protein
MLLIKLIFFVKYGILSMELYVGFWKILGGRDMKKVLRTFLQTASLCAVVVMLTMGINAILGVNISISYYMVMLAGFVVLSFIWSFGMYLLQLKGLGVPVKQNIRSKKSVSSVRQTNYDYQTNNVRKRKVS